MGVVAAGVGAAAITAGASIYGSKKAAKTAKDAANSYERVDIDELQRTARNAVRDNVSNSMAVTKEFTPYVLEAGEATGKAVARKAEQGGRLSADVINSVNQASNETAAASGLGATPITAKRLGLTSMQVQNDAINTGMSYGAANPLVQGGLSPGELASAQVGDLQNLNAYRQQAAGVKAQSQRDTASAVAGAAGTAFGTFFGK